MSSISITDGNSESFKTWDESVVESEDSGCIFNSTTNSTDCVPDLVQRRTNEEGNEELMINNSAGLLTQTLDDKLNAQSNMILENDNSEQNVINGSNQNTELHSINNNDHEKMVLNISQKLASQSCSFIENDKKSSHQLRSLSFPSLQPIPAEQHNQDIIHEDIKLPILVASRSQSAKLTSQHRLPSLSHSCSLPVLICPEEVMKNNLQSQSKAVLPLQSSAIVESKQELLQIKKKPPNLPPIRNVRTVYSENNSQYLPVLKTEDARKRNYLIGNLHSRGAFLGATELERYFPNRKLNLFVATWNVHGTITSESLSDLLLPKELEHVPHMYVIGIQEAHVNRLEWEVKLQETIGFSHVLFYSISFGALHLAVFLRRELIWFCSVVEESTIKLNSSINTKGVVALQFLLFGSSFLFLTSHLTAHDNKVNERIEDYRKILSNLNLPDNNLLRSRRDKNDLLDKYDCVFWFGDLNFRLKQDRDTVMRQIQRISEQVDPNFEDLLRDDELRTNMSTGDVFRGFNEGRINFMPTYKYNCGSDVFDTSEKQRVPSYTDRILYRNRKKNSVSCIFYNSAPSLRSSDHKPVYGLYEVLLRPGRDNVPLAAGMFKRNVYLQAVRNRAKGINPSSGSRLRLASNSSICTIT